MQPQKVQAAVQAWFCCNTKLERGRWLWTQQLAEAGRTVRKPLPPAAAGRLALSPGNRVSG